MRFGLEIFGESLDSKLFHKFADAPFLISRHCHAHLKQKNNSVRTRDGHLDCCERQSEIKINEIEVK